MKVKKQLWTKSNGRVSPMCATYRWINSYLREGRSTPGALNNFRAPSFLLRSFIFSVPNKLHYLALQFKHDLEIYKEGY